MEDEREFESDRQSDSSWVRNWEDQVADEYVAERDTLDQQNKVEQDAIAQKLWLSFQNSASAVTNLYKDCIQEKNCWQPFQNAAGAVTTLYKEAADIQKRNFELGVQVGYNKRIRDILTWAKKRRKHIRKDELIAYLCGKPPPVKPQRHSPPRARCGSRLLSAERSSPIISGSNASDIDGEPDLTAFQNALAIQGLNGAMSNISMGYNNPAQSRSDELTCLIIDGLARHNESRKRNSSNHDSNMDSPTKKRSRFL